MNRLMRVTAVVILIFMLLFCILSFQACADWNIRPDQINVIVIPAEPIPNMIIAPDGRMVMTGPTYPSQAGAQTETVQMTKQTEETEEKQNTAIAVPPEVPEPDGLETEEELTVSDTLPIDIFLLTNEEREKEGVGKLVYNSDLQEAADLRAKECASVFSHTRPDGTSCFTAIGVDYEVAGENLIMADGPLANAKTMMNTWMNSEGHRANILLPEFKEMAVGIFLSDDTVYAVQIFIG